ncbi:DUF6861 domain-containing protein [Roseateles sp. BYS78W]|uniref:DUF6861 domain-containing protein n=1 Tax=Pelomonas candidula TaxID=3299025 RepID=A0ABW7HIN0_9BURK
MANYRIPGPLDASRGNHDVLDGTGQRRAGVTPGIINGPTPGNTSAWDMLVKNYERAEAVYDAVQIGQMRAGAAILRETGHALEELVKGLIPGLLTMMVVLVATTVIGGAIGGVIGFFFGGVGAAPGAVIGADLGVSAGVTILTWLGLGFLVVGIAQGFGELIGALSHATTRAWNAPDSPRTRSEVEAAGDEYAYAIALLFKLILMAIVARLTLGPAKASTQETLALLRKSKLGEGFAEWVAKNQESLLKNPKLRPKPKAAQSEAPVEPSKSPSQVNKEKKQAERAEAAKRLKEHEVPCFHPFDKAKFKKMSAAEQKEYLQEYAKQLRGQQDALNSMTANEYKAARDAYEAVGRNPVADAAQEELRKNVSANIRKSIFDSLRSSGMSAADARTASVSKAAEVMDKLAALHEPDMVAGGWFDPDPTKMGRTDVNSSIGGGWNQASRLKGMDAMVDEAIKNGQGADKLNVKLEPCRGKGLR